MKTEEGNKIVAVAFNLPSAVLSWMFLNKGRIQAIFQEVKMFR